MPKDNVIALWEVSLEFLYGEEYTEGLLAFLRQHKAQSVLDCSRGGGFPSIFLQRAGFDVTVVDGDKNVIAQLRHNLEQERMQMDNHVLDWRALHTLNHEFDAVLCSGNSLVYVGSWHKEETLRDSANSIVSALQNMYEVLRPGGVLYVDMPSEYEYARGPKLDRNFPPRVIHGQEMTLRWKVEHDWPRRVRQVTSEREVGGEVYTYLYHSFMLKHDELRKILHGVGFNSVKPWTLPGERIYQGYVAIK